MSPQGGAPVEVRLLGVPVELHREARAHADALQREFDVLASSGEQPHVPGRLLQLVAELEDRYGSFSAAPASELEAAVARGDATVDLSYVVPPDIEVATRRLDALLDEADDYCRRGEHLLTLAAPPEVAAYRRWFLGQFVEQIRGAAPTSWDRSELARAVGARRATNGTGTSAGARHPVGPDQVPAGWSVEERDDEVVVRPAGELDLQSAPELRDLLLAVRQEHTSQVQLDLSGVSFIDSVGLSMVVSAHQRLSAEGTHLVVGVPPSLERLFEISGLGELLDLRS